MKKIYNQNIINLFDLAKPTTHDRSPYFHFILNDLHTH